MIHHSIGWLCCAAIVVAGVTYARTANKHHDTLKKYALEHDGAVAQGKRLFERQSCSACHGEQGEGSRSAPSLIGLGKRQVRAEIIRSVLEPAASIAPGYQRIRITTAAGKVITGRLQCEPNANPLVVLMPTGERVTVPRAEAEVVHLRPGSDMPDGLVDDLTKEEFADLVAYLRRL